MNKYYKSLLIFIILSALQNSLCAEVYKNKAVVSYYAGDFNGKKTSNGENFNMNDFTCASKNMPFNTVLKVTNLANGLSVNVRVNDRGPFVVGRELDLSKAAAQKINMIKSGTATVKIEIVKLGPETKASRQTADKAAQIMAAKGEKIATIKGSSSSGETVASTTTKKTVSTKTYESGTYWDIQVGSFSSRENANVLAQKLLKQGFEDVIFQKKDGIFRVVIKGVPAKKVQSVENQLINNNYSDYVIRQRKV